MPIQTSKEHAPASVVLLLDELGPAPAAAPAPRAGASGGEALLLRVRRVRCLLRLYLQTPE